MKKTNIILCLIFICIISFSLITHNISGNTDPGSINDPVVTKSYVDAQINEIKKLISPNTNGTSTLSNSSKEEIVEEVLAIIDAIYEHKSTNDNITKPSEEDFAFLPVHVLKGKKLIGGEGAEIIFRSGKATSHSENSMGVIDVSSGVELFNGASISVNHLIIVPRSDGRGINALQDSWFMVKGNYTIK